MGDEDITKDGKKPEKDDTLFTQADVDEIVKTRLARQKRVLQSDHDAAMAEIQGKYDTLKTQTDATIADLTAKFTTATTEKDALNTRLQTFITQQTEALKERKKQYAAETLELLDKLPVEEQVAWMDKNPPSGRKQEDRKKTPPTPPEPKDGDETTDSDLIEKKIESGIYSGL